MSTDKTATLAMGQVEALATACADRDFAALYQTWFHTVLRWIRALGGPGIDADDLAQEVFIIVQRKLARFDGGNLAGWLYRIAHLTVRGHRRRAWFRKIVLRSRDVVLDEVASSAVGQDELFELKRREQLLYQLVGQLNPKWRDSFLLFEVAGLSGDEIAALQRVPAATVRTHLFRARKELLTLTAKLQTKEEW